MHPDVFIWRTGNGVMLPLTIYHNVIDKFVRYLTTEDVVLVHGSICLFFDKGQVVKHLKQNGKRIIYI